MQKRWGKTQKYLQGTGIRTLRFEACEDKDEIVVEIWKLVELLQFLQDLLRSSTIHTHTHTHNKSSHTHSRYLVFDILAVWMNIQLKTLSSLWEHAQSAFIVIRFDTKALRDAKSHTSSLTHTHTDIRILLARLFVSLCLGTGSPWVAEALAADLVHLAATPSYTQDTQTRITCLRSASLPWPHHHYSKHVHK